MDERIRILLEQYIEGEQRGLAPDLDQLGGEDQLVLAALRNAVREYHEAQEVLGKPQDQEASDPQTPAAPANEPVKGGPPASGRPRLSGGGRGGAGFLLLTALFAATCGYSLLRLLWAQSHFRPAVAISENLSLQRTLTSRRDTYGLDPGFHITHVSGQPVSTLPALYDAIDHEGRRAALVRLEQQEEPGPKRQVLWVERSAFAAPLVDSDLRLLDADPLVANGVPAGTRVVQIDGQPVRSVEELTALTEARGGRAMKIAFEERAGDSGVDFVVVTVVEWMVHRTLYLVGVVFGILGLAALWLKPNSRSSRGFVAFCLLVAVFWLTRAIPHHYRFVSERQVYLTAMSAFPVVTVAFLGTFTPLRLSWAPLSRYLIGAGMLSGLFYFGSFVVSPAEATGGLLAYPHLFFAWLGACLALVLLSQFSDSWARLRRKRLEADDLQRARAVRWANLFAFGPYLLISFLTIGPWREQRIWLELSVLAFPLIIAYAIHHRNLLQINELLREALVVTSLVVLLRLGYALLSALALPMMDRWYPDSSVTLRAVLLGGGVVAAGSLHQAARSAVQRSFGTTLHDWRDVARALDQQRAGSTTAPELASSVVQLIADELGATDVSLLVRGPEPGGWWLAARSRTGMVGPILELARPLLEFLAGRDHGSPLFRDDLIDDLRYRRVRNDLLLGMDSLDATIVFPVLLDGRVFGALAVGDRSDRRNYSRDDLRLVEYMCNRIAHDLRTALLLSQQSRAGIAARYPSFPARIGKFTIEHALGEGGMAFVFLGVRDGRRAAIKVPNLHVQRTPTLLERFLRERSLLRTLEHRNIVPIIESGWAMGEPYFAMEYYPRGTLHDYLSSRRRLDEHEALALTAQIGRGLSAALRHGVTHRDLKPKNVFFSDDGDVKVGDFGLARIDQATTLTSEGHAFGTPAYMSPEVLLGQRADWRSDQYALGICLFEMLLGRKPFEGSTFEVVRHQHLHQAIPSPRQLRPELLQTTEVAVHRMLAKSPADRYQTYEQVLMAVDLDRQETA